MKGISPSAGIIFNSPSLNEIVKLYSLLYSKVVFANFKLEASLFSFSFKVQNSLNLFFKGFHILQVALYSLFKLSVIYVS